MSCVPQGTQMLRMAPTGYPGTRNVNNELAKQMVNQSLVSNTKAFFFRLLATGFLESDVLYTQAKHYFKI